MMIYSDTWARLLETGVSPMPKTSLMIDEQLFLDAKKAALKEKKSMSQVICDWAKAGKLQNEQHAAQQDVFQPLSLGGLTAKIDFTSRRIWMDELDDLP